MRRIREIRREIPAELRKKRVAVYARVSTDSEKLMHSLAAQVRCYTDYIQMHSEWIYSGVYADEGISGTGTEKRDEFRRMVEDCEEGKLDIILVKSVSRFARNTVDLLKTVRRLKELGVEVRFEKENINSLSGDGELMLSILASFAQEESRSISDNVKWGIRKRYEKGIPNGRGKIFGYRWEYGRLIIEESEADIVRRIFSEFLDGKSPRRIAKGLNDEGTRTAKGCLWSDSGIRYILTNVTYTGNMLLQKMFVDDAISKRRKKNNGELARYFAENTHDAIISRNIFECVQEELSRRSRKRGQKSGEDDNDNSGDNQTQYSKKQ